MFNRILGIPILLGAAMAVPYLSTNGPEDFKAWWAKRGQESSSESEDSASSRPDVKNDSRPLFENPRGPGYEIYPDSTPLEGERSVALDEVFRFDATKEWVYQRWARKSTALAELGLYGVRVPLVTGTEIHDLAGSLTYFFDQFGKVQRISFQGHTGDTTKAIALAQQHGLQPQTTAIVGEQLLQAKRGNDVISELRTRPSSVLWSSSPHDSFAVELELQRPESATPLPSRLPPLPEVKLPPSELASGERASASGETNDPANKGLRESMKAFFPRSRVPAGQVESLEKRDRLW